MADKISQIQLPNGVIYDIDTRVQQTASTIETPLPILLGYGAAPSTTGITNYVSGITITPSTKEMNLGSGSVSAAIFSGALEGNATSATSANEAGHATEADYAASAGIADHSDTTDAFKTAVEIGLTGAITGSSSSTNNWSIVTSITNGAIQTAHIADEAITITKLADEIGVVVVQSDTPANDSAAKIWVKI